MPYRRIYILCVARSGLPSLVPPNPTVSGQLRVSLDDFLNRQGKSNSCLLELLPGWPEGHSHHESP